MPVFYCLHAHIDVCEKDLCMFIPLCRWLCSYSLVYCSVDETLRRRVSYPLYLFVFPFCLFFFFFLSSWRSGSRLSPAANVPPLVPSGRQAGPFLTGLGSRRNHNYPIAAASLRGLSPQVPSTFRKIRRNGSLESLPELPIVRRNCYL